MKTQQLRAYSCTVVGTDWATVVHAFSAGKAKHLYWREVRDAWPDTPFTAIRARSLGAPRTTDRFEHTRRYRNAWFRQGDKVRVFNSFGFVADSDDSANFVIHCIGGEMAGRIIHAHISEIYPIHEEERCA